MGLEVYVDNVDPNEKLCYVIPAHHTWALRLASVLFAVSIALPHFFSPFLISWVSIVSLGPAATVALTVAARFRNDSIVNLDWFVWHFYLAWFVLVPLTFILWAAFDHVAIVIRIAAVLACVDTLKILSWRKFTDVNAIHKTDSNQFCLNAVMTGLSLSSGLVYYGLSIALVSAGLEARVAELFVVLGLLTVIFIPMEILASYGIATVLQKYRDSEEEEAGESAAAGDELETFPQDTLENKQRTKALWIATAWVCRVIFVWSFMAALDPTTSAKSKKAVAAAYLCVAAAFIIFGVRAFTHSRKSRKARYAPVEINDV